MSRKPKTTINLDDIAPTTPLEATPVTPSVADVTGENVFEAIGFAQAGVDLDLGEALAKYGFTDVLYQAFVLGYMRRALNVDRETALAIRALLPFDYLHPKSMTPANREKVQQDAMGSARTAWSRALAKAGIDSPRSRGKGNKNAEKREAAKAKAAAEAAKAKALLPAAEGNATIATGSNTPVTIHTLVVEHYSKRDDALMHMRVVARHNDRVYVENVALFNVVGDDEMAAWRKWIEAAPKHLGPID